MAIERAAIERSAQRGRWRQTLQRPQFWFGAAVLVPIFLWYAVFAFWPILDAVFMSVVSYKLLEPTASKFVGLKNFQDLLSNDLFWVSLEHTLIYAVTLFVAILPLSLLISSCLTSVIRGRNFYQFVIFLPVVVSLVAISLLFKYLMDPQVGLFDWILAILQLPQSKFLSGDESALFSVIGVDVWKSTGFYVVILTAGLLGIPQSMYDAAMVDGASALSRFFHVTLPLLGHTLALVSVLIMFQGLQVFTQVDVLPASPGGPGRSTYVMNLLVWDEAFQQLHFGVATAAAFVLFVLIFMVTLIQLKLIRPTWSY